MLENPLRRQAKHSANINTFFVLPAAPKLLQAECCSSKTLPAVFLARLHDTQLQQHVSAKNLLHNFLAIFHSFLFMHLFTARRFVLIK